MIVKAAAKINLLLDVAGILPDGYHSLNMIMQSVSCYDTVRVDRTGGEEIRIITADKRVPTGEKNIAYKAAREFFRRTRITRGRGIEIEIDKQIPLAAGVAGGALLISGAKALGEFLEGETDRSSRRLEERREADKEEVRRITANDPEEY